MAAAVVAVALTAGEETGGHAGVHWLVEHRPELLDAELALNEGGALQLTPDGKRMQVVRLAVAEKVYQSYRLVVRGAGGHSSQPPTDGDPTLPLARALVRIAEHRFPARVLPEVREAFAIDATFRATAARTGSRQRGVVRAAPRGRRRTPEGHPHVRDPLRAGNARRCAQSRGRARGRRARRPVAWLTEGVRYVRALTLELAR